MCKLHEALWETGASLPILGLSPWPMLREAECHLARVLHDNKQHARWLCRRLNLDWEGHVRPLMVLGGSWTPSGFQDWLLCIELYYELGELPKITGLNGRVSPSRTLQNLQAVVLDAGKESHLCRTIRYDRVWSKELSHV